MRKSCFSEEQTIGMPKGHQAGIDVADLCGKHGFSDGSFHTSFEVPRMEMSETRWLESLAEENAKLKTRLAALILDVSARREALGKNF